MSRRDRRRAESREKRRAARRVAAKAALLPAAFAGSMGLGALAAAALSWLG